jgi:hypothetical protein
MLIFLSTRGGKVHYLVKPPQGGFGWVYFSKIFYASIYALWIAELYHKECIEAGNNILNIGDKFCHKILQKMPFKDSLYGAYKFINTLYIAQAI